MSSRAFDVDVVRTIPRHAEAVGIPVPSNGAVPRAVGLGRAMLDASGFEGKLGQTLALPSAGGRMMVAVGVGAQGSLDAAGVRTATASFVRAVGKRRRLATTIADVDGIDPMVAGQAAVEGAALATYRFSDLKSDAPAEDGAVPTMSFVARAQRADGVRAGARTGLITARAASLARDLANMPPAHLTARSMAQRAVEVAAQSGLSVEVLNKDQLEQMGCGGMIGVNKGSTEPPRVVKLQYQPEGAQGHVALVGKGVMYDSGGISLKPTDAMHVLMKLDMTGAASVLAAMSALSEMDCKVAVTGYLMCTDNMPSGSAMKLGDVLTIRNGKTVEVHNTDAEGRLILADGLSLAAEDEPDAIVDVATLTGACVVALGEKIAGVLGNDQGWIDQVTSAGSRADEPAWQLPLAQQYRKLLESNVADMRNVGGPYGGTITAAVFLSEFVGDIPWAHLDIAGPMKSDADEGWMAKGATGFGTRLLIDLLLNFQPVR